jgi:TPR repeat protein
LPKTLTLLERAVALAVRGFNQDESVSQLSHASARCFLKGPNLKPLYLEGARLDLADVQFALANDLAKTTAFPGFWHEAVKMYRHVAATATPPLSVIAATSAARVSERLLTADTTHPSPMDWPEILATYRAGMAAGHEAALALYADALQQGLGGLSPDTAEAVRLYKALLDKNDGLFGGLMAIAFMVHAQEQITTLWRAGKLELNEAEQRRYLLSSARS